MKRRALLILLTTCLGLMFSGVAASAVVTAPDISTVNTNQVAVYLNDAYYQNSGSVTGDIYSVKGKIEFGNAGDNVVNGNIYHKTGTQYIYNTNSAPTINGAVVTGDTAAYNGSFPSLAAFPTISNYVASYDGSPWNASALTISSNTHFGSFIVGSHAVTVDTSAGDIFLVVDSLTDNWNCPITVSGSGRLFLFVKTFNSVGPLMINNGSNPDKTYIFSKTSLSHSNLNLYAHVYYDSLTSLTPSGKITGSVVTNATTVLLSGGGNIINGLLYAPNAAVSVQSDNSNPNVTGRVVANSLSLTNSGDIVYSSAYASLDVPAQLQNQTVSVTSNNAAGGTVTSSVGGTAFTGSKSVSYGTVVNVTASANPGYTFTGFDSSVASMTPDSSGNVTITGDVTLTANFASNDLDYHNGLLGEYYDTSGFENESALKMKRIDSQIAYNFGYDTSPDPTIEPETFAIRWTGFIKPTTSGYYTFKTYSDDGVKVTVGSSEVLDSWGLLSLGFTSAQTPIYLQSGTYYPITVEYQQLPLYAAVYLSWQLGDGDTKLIPSSVLYVTQQDYADYSSAVYYNPVQKSGEGLSNVFYTVNDDETHNTYSETNNLDYSWGLGAPGTLDKDVFYGTMDGYLEAKYTEATTLDFTVDDGIKVWIDDELVIDRWGWHDAEIFPYTFNAVAGHKYKIHIEYVDMGIGATLEMRWESANIEKQIIPVKYLYTSL